MEKLLKLLNEYDSIWDYDDYYGPYQYGQDSDAYKYGKYYLVSRDYGFIKWLVDNDKIDTKKVEIGPFSDKLVYSDSDCTVYRSDTTYEMLLMLLAIKDEPIEFLISILK